ncbi:hypothetical protein OPIT5_00005 (plasmid) [Opitutaceae bacterium TAV5]|nr:hypothetical protein OPIT5_00005 [Opitutaceae bacterium TAV5]
MKSWRWDDFVDQFRIDRNFIVKFQLRSHASGLYKQASFRRNLDVVTRTVQEPGKNPYFLVYRRDAESKIEKFSFYWHIYGVKQLVAERLIAGETLRIPSRAILERIRRGLVLAFWRLSEYAASAKQYRKIHGTRAPLLDVEYNRDGTLLASLKPELLTILRNNKADDHTAKTK